MLKVALVFTEKTEELIRHISKSQGMSCASYCRSTIITQAFEQKHREDILDDLHARYRNDVVFSKIVDWMIVNTENRTVTLEDYQQALILTKHFKESQE